MHLYFPSLFFCYSLTYIHQAHSSLLPLGFFLLKCLSPLSGLSNIFFSVKSYLKCHILWHRSFHSKKLHFIFLCDLSASSTHFGHLILGIYSIQHDAFNSPFKKCFTLNHILLCFYFLLFFNSKIKTTLSNKLTCIHNCIKEYKYPEGKFLKF